MSIFGNIMSAIFKHAGAASAPAIQPSTPAAPGSTPAASPCTDLVLRARSAGAGHTGRR